MPTYQYACKDCGNQFEQVQSFSDPSLTTCPSCGGSLRKVYGSVGVVFKGSGFYRTDSRSGSHSSSLAAGSKSDGAGAGTGKSDSAGAASTPSTPSSPAAKVAASSGSSAPAKAAS